MNVLFLEQGRAVPDAAFGLVRVRRAREVALSNSDADLRFTHVEVPPLNRTQRRFNRRVEPLGQWNFGSVRWHLTRGWGARKIVREHLRSDPPDVVHVTTDQVSFLLGGLQRRVPCVLSLDILAFDWACLKRGIDPLGDVPGWLSPLRALEKRSLEHSPLAVAWTDTVADRIRALTPRANVATLHPGLDLDGYRPREHGPAPGPLRVLFVGGRWEAKGGPDLLAALRPELGTTVLLDVVTRDEVDPVEGMTVHSGEPGGASVADLFAEADVFCLPTSVDGTPLVIVEAMASGVPVVSTSVGSIPELVGDAGAITRPRDVERLRSTLLALLESRGTRATMGEAGRARAEKQYDAAVNTARLLELLEGVVTEYRSSRKPSPRRRFS